MALFQQLWSRDQWAGLPVYRSILSPLMLLERSLHVFPERTAIVDGDRRHTYAELGGRVYRLASALGAHGVSRGDRVALLCRNSGEVLEAHFAVPQLGGRWSRSTSASAATRSATSCSIPARGSCSSTPSWSR